ncbi:MAG: cell division protein FtsZ [Parcubacteria group bacterium]|nr:cell division protein FtsZ [Parcubacteria group bacterium]
MEIRPDIEQSARIKVVGVGGSGGNAINRMMKDKIKGVVYVAINTDAQALHHCSADEKVHIGKSATRGLGAGMNPELGQAAAEESKNDITEIMKGADMVFVTCGLGGGTGSGAAPIVANTARELGALTIGVVTKPFSFEGTQRREIAETAWEHLSTKVDALITIPNDRILQIIDRKTSLLDAFAIVDEVLRQGVRGISDLITTHGVVNVDFADVKTIMQGSGSALMGIGRASGENRAVEAAKAAIDSPLLEVSIEGARGILFNVTGSPDLGMYEIDEAAKVITEHADPNAKVIFGAVIDETLKNEIMVTVVATNFNRTGEARETTSISKPLSGVNFFSGGNDGPMRHVPATPPVIYPTKVIHKEVGAARAPKEPPVVERPLETMVPASRQDTTGKQAPDQTDLDIPAFIRRKMR